MFQLKPLHKENDLNKIRASQKHNKSSMSVLFISEWDEWSTKLVEALQEKYGDNEKGERLFIVNSFEMPHSFVIYGSTKVPHLVRLRKDRVRSEFYLANIYKQLKVS